MWSSDKVAGHMYVPFEHGCARVSLVRGRSEQLVVKVTPADACLV